MDPRARDYLIRAHNKVIAHYRQVLQSLSPAERAHIQKRLADAEAELASFSGGSHSLHFAEAA